MGIIFLIASIFLISAASPFVNGRRRRLLPPGPKGWPLLGNLLQLGPKPTHQAFQALSESHAGDGLLHLRFGVADVVVLSSASAAAKCFRSHDASLSGRPRDSTSKHMAYNSQDLIMAPYGPQWRMLRKLCSLHLFSNRALNGFRHVRREEAARLAREISAGRGAAVEVGGLVNTCATNALARMLLGRRVIDGGDEAVRFKEMAGEMTRLAGQFNIGDFVPGIGWLDLQGVTRRMKKVHDRFGEFLDKIIAEHGMETDDDQFQGGDHVNDFLSTLIGINGSKEGERDKLTNVQIKALLQDMFIAGTDTTSITVEWILTELIRNPHMLARAQQELDSIAGRHRLISESEASKSPYLQSIIKESFRLHPPVPLAASHLATEDCPVDRYLIPKGTILLINVWAIGRDPVSWPDDPTEFNPDRFAPGSRHENADVKGNDFELIPFGVGRRICAGMNLGLRMVYLLTAILIHSFEWSLPDGQRTDALDMEEGHGATMRKVRPLMAIAAPRLATEAYIQ